MEVYLPLRGPNFNSAGCVRAPCAVQVPLLPLNSSNTYTTYAARLSPLFFRLWASSGGGVFIQSYYTFNLHVININGVRFRRFFLPNKVLLSQYSSGCSAAVDWQNSQKSFLQTPTGIKVLMSAFVFVVNSQSSANHNSFLLSDQ